MPVEEQTSMALDRMKRVVKEERNAGSERASVETAKPGEEPGSSPSESGDTSGPAGTPADVRSMPGDVSATGAPSGPSEGARGDLVVSGLPQNGGLALKTPDWGVGDSWLAEYERQALRVATSVALPEALRCGGDSKASARAVLAIALAGRELGIGFMEATRQIDLINGQTALRAELKMALARRAGLVIDSIEETATSCTIKAHRSDTGEAGEGSFTEADKKQAKLGRAGSAWETYPADMYWARASARLLRRLCPDFRGASFRSTEELSEEIRES